MRFGKKYLKCVVLVLPLLLATICLGRVSFSNQQAMWAFPMPLSLIGEYSYDRVNWLPLTEEAEISALDGDLYLRGHFDNELRRGWCIRHYRNHIGLVVYVNGQQTYIDAVAEMAGMGRELQASMCGREWNTFVSPGITPQDTVEIHLINPHTMGNETAYMDFLTTMCASVQDADLLQKNLEKYGAPFRIVGSLCTVVSLLILGASAAAVIVHKQVSGKLFEQGMLVMFAGGFIVFDTIDASLWNELTVLNTYACQLCVMMAVFLLERFVSDSLTGRRKCVVIIALGVSSALNSALIFTALVGWTVIYDTLPYWVYSQIALCPLIGTCCALELRAAKKKRRLVLMSGVLMFAGILIDIFDVGETIVWRNPCSKMLFILLLLIHFMDAARSMVLNHRAKLRAEKLEEELENSRIAIMLSQIQPHFLYNVLGTIRGLCREDPMKARQALGDFSDYLRGNMNALANSDTIHFSTELRHIEAYLRLEKMRMGDKLNILYDIQEKSFFIPPLTIQPLVENAIKHGLFEKGVGTLILHTHSDADHIIVSVQDDGVGFDQTAPLMQDDRHAHVGLINVRSRLEKISGGRLVIDSAPDRGTTATVFLHDDCKENGGMKSNEYTGRR